MNNLNLTQRQLSLFNFIKLKHGDQKRKYTDDPYWKHLVEVATIVQHSVRDLMDTYMVEIALAHDVLEDTNCTVNELYSAAIQIGYSEFASSVITSGVQDLTDVYTSKNVPALNREARKRLEAARLSKVNPDSQTVKYADLISNTNSIANYDPDFAKVYLREKEMLLEVMTKGHQKLYWRTIHVWQMAMDKVYPAQSILLESDYKRQIKLWTDLVDDMTHQGGTINQIDKLSKAFKLDTWQ